MIVYQASDDQWIVYNNNIKTYFATQGEAIAMSSKIKFAEQVQEFVDSFCALEEDAPSFQEVWDDREYLSGEDGKAITTEDIESLGITKAELTAFITFVPQLFNFMHNLEITGGDYSATLNQLRTDK